MRTDRRYQRAERITPGVAICNAGFEGCPMSDSNHWHCARCGKISGHQGCLYKRDDGEWVMRCEEEDNEQRSA